MNTLVGVNNDDSDLQLKTEVQVCELVQYHKSTIRRLIDAGKFPRSIYLDPDKNTGKRWYARDIYAYMKECAEKSGYFVDKNKTIAEVHAITAEKYPELHNGMDHNPINNIPSVREKINE